MQTQKALTVTAASEFLGLSQHYIYKLIHLKKSHITSRMVVEYFSNKVNWSHSFSETGKALIMRSKAMLKEKKPQDGRSIRDSDTLILTDKFFDGNNIPVAAIKALKEESTGLLHGTVTLALHVKDGNLYRFTINRERSIVPDKPMTGSTHDK